MSTHGSTGLYEEDLKGTNPNNLITDEIQTLIVPGPDDYYFIIPHAAPFFADSLVLTNAQTGAELKENRDFVLGHYFIEGMKSIGRPIVGSIRFSRRDITGQVKIQYRTLGGPWGYNQNQVLAELAKVKNNPLRRNWGSIGPLPYSFPPLDHDQSMDTIVGSKEINDSLIKIAEVLEASAAGTSESHIKDFDNPHRTNKKQVGLEFVQNFGIASDAEARAGVAQDKYMTPYGVSLYVAQNVMTTLNDHINAKGNVHDLKAADINLGNVPNYPAATPAQAIDITNDRTLLTPYTASLLFESLSVRPDLDALIARVNAHLADRTTNPHGINPAMIGTYTAQQIDEKIAAVSGGGGDASTFGGKTPDQWASEFVSTEDFNKFIGPTQFGGAITESANNISAVDDKPAVDPIEEQAIIASRVSGVNAGYGVYVVNSSRWDIRFVAQTGVNQTGQRQFPDVLGDGNDRWAAIENGYYYITKRGGVVSWGANAIQVPAGYSETNAFDPAKAMSFVYASKREVFMRGPDSDDMPPKPTALYHFDSAGVVTTAIPASREPWSVVMATEKNKPGRLVIIECTNASGDTEWEVLGDPATVSSVKGILNGLESAGIGINRVNLNDDYALIQTAEQGAKMYRIDRTGTAMTFVHLPAAMIFDSHGNTRKVEALPSIVQAAGTANHFAMIDTDGKAWFFGDNTYGQCEVEVNVVPLIAIAAGDGFTVTVNALWQTNFYGDVDDNSLLYNNRGTGIIVPE